MKKLNPLNKNSLNFDDATLEFIYALEFIVYTAVPGIIKASMIIHQYIKDIIIPKIQAIYSISTEIFNEMFNISSTEVFTHENNTYNKDLQNLELSGMDSAVIEGHFGDHF